MELLIIFCAVGDRRTEKRGALSLERQWLGGPDVIGLHSVVIRRTEHGSFQTGSPFMVCWAFSSITKTLSERGITNKPYTATS
jgi:hypothetical protein